MIYAVIMAGGTGTRFWPRSRTTTPKQLLNIFDHETMIQKTVARVGGFAPSERVMIVTNALQQDGVRKQLPSLPLHNILIEPVGRNTAPCIGLAAIHILKNDPDGIMAVLAADHLIEPNDKFCETIRFAASVAADTGGLVTMGMIPSRPETGYGYIQFLENDKIHLNGREAYRVKTFAEKPNFATAQRFLDSGDFLWNSGMFIWKASVILELIEEFLPDLHDGLMEIRESIGTPAYDETLNRVYRSVKGISIDYGVMEKAKNVFVIKGDFTWNDVGSWEEVYQLSPKDGSGNVVTGNTIVLDSANSLVHSGNKMIATVGVQNLIIVDTGDAVLICDRSRAQDVKKIVEELQRKDLKELL